MRFLSVARVLRKIPAGCRYEQAGCLTSILEAQYFQIKPYLSQFA